jgi:hypothetical protein
MNQVWFRFQIHEDSGDSSSNLFLNRLSRGPRCEGIVVSLSEPELSSEMTAGRFLADTADEDDEVAAIC